MLLSIDRSTRGDRGKLAALAQRKRNCPFGVHMHRSKILIEALPPNPTNKNPDWIIARRERDLLDHFHRRSLEMSLLAFQKRSALIVDLNLDLPD